MTFETEQEDDGRWLAGVPELPGVLAYGRTKQQAITKAEALALRVLMERQDCLAILAPSRLQIMTVF